MEAYADPAWSPDGRKIAFVSNRDGNSEVYVMNANGSGQRNLHPRNPAYDADPTSVARRAEDRLRQQPRRQLRRLPHERGRQRTAEGWRDSARNPTGRKMGDGRRCPDPGAGQTAHLGEFSGMLHDVGAAPELSRVRRYGSPMPAWRPVPDISAADDVLRGTMPHRRESHDMVRLSPSTK